MPCDYSKYPLNWKTEIRPRILARAGQLIVDGKIEKQAKCENCGVLNRAHLDHDPENHEVQDDRLAALCQYCHLRYDAPMKAARKKAEKDAVKSAGLFV